MGNVAGAGRRAPAVLGAVAAVIAAAAIAAAGQGPRVRVEKKPRYIAAGRGQKPFDVTRHLIPLGGIQGGGPPKDGIPALTNPAFVAAAAADRVLRARDVVLGVAFGGEAKAYPVRILNWHEIVNDTVGGRALLVSW